MRVHAIIFIPFLFLILLSCDKKENILNKNLNSKIDSIDLLPNVKQQAALDQNYKTLINRKNDSINRSLLLKICGKYFNNGLYSKYATATRALYNLSVEENDTLQMANALYYLGDYYEVKFKMDSALSYYTQAEKFYRDIKDTINSGKLQLYKAGILHETGNFSESEVETIRALGKLKEGKNKRLIYECYLLIALSLKDQHNYSKSLEYFDLALEKIDELEKENPSKVIYSRASCYNNMGLLYEKKEDYYKAIALYKKAFATNNLRKGKPILYSMLLSNMAYSKMQLGQWTDTKKMLNESLFIRDSLKNISGIIASKIRLGEYYLLQKDTLQAVDYFKEGYKLSVKIRSHYDILKSLKLLSQTDKDRHYYSNLYYKVNDSLLYVERSTRDKFARIAFETDIVENKYRDLIRRNILIIIVSLCAVFLLLCFSIVLKFRAKNKELKLIHGQQTANEEIYRLMLDQQVKTKEAQLEERNRISMDLHDGIINRIFITRYNLMKLESTQLDFRDRLIQELLKTEEEIRLVSHNLNKNFQEGDTGFYEIINELVTSQKNQFSTLFDLHIDKLIVWNSISSENKMHLYKIIQEALNNVNKYSNANECTIVIIKVNNSIRIEIKDNGTGFDPQPEYSGIGLKNIAARIKRINGRLKINSKVGSGTKIEVEIDLF